MSEEHYSGHDPETGCGIMLIVGAIVLILVLGFVAGWALNTWL